MDIDTLKKHLDSFSQSLAAEDRKLLTARLESLISAFPFNEYEYCLMFLLEKGAVQFAEYEKLRKDYVSSNKYLELFELAPRTFGETWGHQHLIDLDGRFMKPNKSVDPEYEGQYDLRFEGIRIEVKACRAINTKKHQSLVSKALHYESREPFWMNFQQIKLDIADVFVFIGVWIDRIIYWVLSNDEAKNNQYISSQHRGGIEYQIGITDNNIRDFDSFMVEQQDIAKKILEKMRDKNRSR
jgi:hypothetical protein